MPDLARPRRSLRIEGLEPRVLLASDFQSPYQPLDVNVDLAVAASDAVVVQERLRQGIGPISSAPPGSYPDVTGDGIIAPLDVLRVINQIHRDTPVITARLMQDTAPQGQVNHDRITHDCGVLIKLSQNAARIELAVDDGPPIDLSQRLSDRSLSLSAEDIDALLPSPISDGVHHFRVSLPDHQQAIEFTVHLDRRAPAPELTEEDGILRRQRKYLEFTFDEPFSADAIAPTNFAIEVAEGAEAGQPITITGASQEDDRVRLELDERLKNATYRLVVAGGISDAAGNSLAAAELSFVVDQLATLAMDTATQRVSVERENPTVSALWDAAAQQAIVNVSPGPTVASRAFAMVHTAIYDAWSAYDDLAISTQLGDTLQRPADENTPANKTEAMSFAAYRVLDDLFASETAIFDDLMADLGYDPDNLSEDVTTPAGVGNVMAAALLDYRHQDGANQLGDDSAGDAGIPYSSTVSYSAANDADHIRNIDRWTPEYVPLGSTAATHERVQRFLTPHWGTVEAFSLSSPDQFRPDPPQPFLLVEGSVDLEAKTITLDDGSVLPIDRSLIGTIINPEFIAQADQIVEISANLDDKQKLIAEFWEDAAHTSFPPGTWMSFGQFVSARDSHTLDDDARMFFALGNAVFDVGIATWESKVHYDYVRPVRAIRELGRLGLIGEFSAGHGGYVVDVTSRTGDVDRILASEFLTYQTPESDPSPPFAEYTSGHSGFSGAGATILKLFTGSDEFGASVTFGRGDSRFHPGRVPRQSVTLDWDTFQAAADEAGMSRLYGAIHFSDGNQAGIELGRQVGEAVWNRAQYFIQGGDGG